MARQADDPECKNTLIPNSPYLVGGTVPVGSATMNIRSILHTPRLPLACLLAVRGHGQASPFMRGPRVMFSHQVQWQSGPEPGECTRREDWDTASLAGGSWASLQGPFLAAHSTQEHSEAGGHVIQTIAWPSQQVPSWGLLQDC